ncbi:MAG: MFS transporter [Acidiferrobacteraceae bacterium]
MTRGGAIRGFGQALRSPDFLRLWIGQVVSMLGDRLDQMGIVALYAAAGSRSVTALLAMLAALAIAPQLLVSLVAGKIIDRVDRRWVLIGSDLVRACLVLLLPFAFRTRGADGVYAVVFAVGAATAFFTPAKSSIIPSLVPSGALPAANGLSGITNILGTLVGSFVGAHLAHGLGVDRGRSATPFFAIDAATYLVSAFLVWRIITDLGGRSRHAPQIPEKRPEGLSALIVANPEICWMLAASVLFWAAAAVVYSAMNSLAYVRFHRGVLGIGNMQSSFSIGMLIGALTGGKDRRGSFAGNVWPLLLGTSAALAWLNGTRTWPEALASVLVVGVFAAWLIIQVDTALQRATPDALRGRVFGLKQQLTAAAFILPSVGFHFDRDLDRDLPRFVFVSLWILASVAAVFMFRAMLQALDGACRADWGRRWMNRLDGLNRILCGTLHGLEVSNVRLPPSGAALLAANHISGLDPMLLIASVDRPLRFLIAEDEYERWWLKWLFRAMGCIPVRPGQSQHVLAQARKALEAGEVVALFPEGGIHRPGASGRLKRGVALLAEITCAPVFPVHVSGVRGIGLRILAVFLPDRARVTGFPELVYESSYRERGQQAFLDDLAVRLGGQTP